MQLPDDRAPNVPDFPDSGHHAVSPFGALKQLLPQARGSVHGGGPASAEAQLAFHQSLVVTLGAMQANLKQQAAAMAHLQKGIVAWQNPPYKLERLDLGPGNLVDRIRLPAEAGERWLLASTWSLPADGNSAHTPDSLFVTNGLADIMGRLTIPNGKTDWGIHVNMPAIIEFSQTSATNYVTTLLALFRREWRYEDLSWSVEGENGGPQ